ncbi:hypothetical protein TNCV_510321 [Trichonephila clavipes]|nr:hypothetical protein TNCV_510321 [Trichonephila clavipes]
MIWINPDQRKLQRILWREHGRTNKNIQSIENGDIVESLQVVNDININRCIVVEQPEVIELHDSPRQRPSQHMELSSTANP